MPANSIGSITENSLDLMTVVSGMPNNVTSLLFTECCQFRRVSTRACKRKENAYSLGALEIPIYHLLKSKIAFSLSCDETRPDFQRHLAAETAIFRV